ncbi:MAG: M15 family metallopeptidase [Ignavibacteria bacterium]|nr:M15 family metallopeptidase [Ignavibacteria bacterium]
MKNKIGISLAVFYILTFFFVSCSKNPEVKTVENTSATVNQNNRTQKKFEAPIQLQNLVNSYPEYLDSADEKFLYWKDGSKMIWDDGKKKSFEEMLENPDLEDMMSIEYPVGKDWDSPPAKNFDPGRIRQEEFFKKMYGSNEKAVRENCVSVDWFGIPVLISRINGVDNQLKKVIQDLKKLPLEFQKYLTKTGGTFNWRFIKNTERLSTHSFATAIDINTDFSDYWEWSKVLIYKNRIPIEIAEVFEKHGFIWGGKWYHYDTMHFEYRPELLYK